MKSTDPAIPADDEFTEDSYSLIIDALALDDAGLRRVVEGIHPADFSDCFEQLAPDQREDFIHRVGDLISGEILTELEDEVVEDILPLLSSAQIVSAITEMDNDDATQIIEEMEDEQREEILEAISSRKTAPPLKRVLPLTMKPLVVSCSANLWPRRRSGRCRRHD